MARNSDPNRSNQARLIRSVWIAVPSHSAFSCSPSDITSIVQLLLISYRSASITMVDHGFEGAEGIEIRSFSDPTMVILW